MTNVVTGLFGSSTPPEIIEPDWLLPYVEGEWGKRRAGIASERWAVLVACMRERSLLDVDNDVMIEMAAAAYADWKLAEAHVAMFGPVVPAPRTGVPMHNPYKALADAALKRCQTIERDLGIPPIERGRATKAAPRGKKQTRAADEFAKPRSA